MFSLFIQRNMVKMSERKRLEKVGKTIDLNCYLYHQIIGHPTKDCYIIKDKIQALIEARLIHLRAKQKRVTTNMTTFKMGALKVPLGISQA